jgi:CelD/BcsL family acetyltransferase involved in cellulose biosynthesis
MISSFKVTLLNPSELTTNHWQAWARIANLGAGIKSPYANPAYIQMIAPEVPQAMIARFSQTYEHGERVCGYLAYQMRGGVLQPLGTPLTDYMNLTLINGEDQPMPPAQILSALKALLLATKANQFEAVGLLGLIEPNYDTLLNETPAEEGLNAQTRRVADLRMGFDTWYATQDNAHGKYFKNLRRCQRNLKRDLPNAVYEWRRADKELLEWVIQRKRNQYAKSHYHDIFACGWTKDLLMALASSENEEMVLTAGVLSLDGRIIAAEIALQSNDYLHLWYPAYDEALARHSLGIVLVFEMIKDAAARGVKFVDFGTGSEAYKIPFTSPINDCARLILKSPKQSLFDLSTEVCAELITSLNPPKLKPWRTAVSERLMSIRGCETKKLGRLKAMICLWDRFVEKLFRRLRRSLTTSS